MSSRSSFNFEVFIHSSPETIYPLFTSAFGLQTWLCNTARVSENKNSYLFMAWNSGYYMTGEMLQQTENKEVLFTWQGRAYPRPTLVQVTLTPQNNGTQVQVIQSMVGSGIKWKTIRGQIREGWKSSLRNLSSVVESGRDLRITERAILGINVADFNSEISARLGIGISNGVRIGSVVEGLGAYLAGLCADDVLVEMNGQKLAEVNDLLRISAYFHAGDTVSVTFYRGNHLLKTNMTFSAVPDRILPATPTELAVSIQSAYQNAYSQLITVLENINEQEADAVPAVGEWSVKGVLAHLIHTEHDLHFWIQKSLCDQDFKFPENSAARIQATLNVYPTLADLCGELKRTMDETCAFLAALPPEFTARRGNYWQLSYFMVNMHEHILSHLPQILNSAEAARTLTNSR